MKYLLILFLSFAPCDFSNAAVQVDKYPLSDALLSEELRTGKAVLVECYTTWCKPCKKMSKEVFSSDVLKRYLDTTYILHKVDMESEEGILLAKKYSVKTYPTFLIFRNSVMVHKFIGAYNLDAFIKILQKNEPVKQQVIDKN